MIRYFFLIFFLVSCSTFQGERFPNNYGYEATGRDLFYTDGRPVDDYEDAVRNLRPGDKVRFPDGNSFTLGERLGNGGATVIFDVGEGKALRIPIHEWAIELKLMEQFLELYNKLDDESIPLIKVFTNESSLDGTYAVVEKVDFEIDLPKYLKSGTKDPAKEKGLRHLLYAFAPYAEFPDFKLDQFVWDGEEWVMLDWSNQELIMAKSMTDPFAATDIMAARPKYADEFIKERADYLGVSWTKDDLKRWVDIIKGRRSGSRCHELVGGILFN